MSKSKDAAATSVVLKYLNDQNRPYSAQDVFGNLQKEHGLGKTAVVKALEQLAQQGQLKEKVYGKQKIYFADQDQFSAVSDSDLKRLDSQISELSTKVQSVQQSCRQMDSGLHCICCSVILRYFFVDLALLIRLFGEPIL
nr:PREDICTED: homologous-pairing protein 2 homolog isoform X2 [Latimeria chalumnae]|eukprot:XP_005994111.1 PREDICTED: homologous-pairing protein 2 homolog isoform X2 [Latimeria chalumnae]